MDLHTIRVSFAVVSDNPSSHFPSLNSSSYCPACSCLRLFMRLLKYSTVFLSPRLCIINSWTSTSSIFISYINFTNFIIIKKYCSWGYFFVGLFATKMTLYDVITGKSEGGFWWDFPDLIITTFHFMTPSLFILFSTTRCGCYYWFNTIYCVVLCLLVVSVLISGLFPNNEIP